MIGLLIGTFVKAESLEGWITHNGEAISNVRVLAVDLRMRAHEALTDADGHYQMVEVPSGTYRLIAIPPDPSLALARVYPSETSYCMGDSLVIDGNHLSTSIDLPSGAEIYGTIVYPDGTPISGVPIVAEPVEELGADGSVPRLGWTDENGAFEILGLENSQPESLWRCVFESDTIPTQFIGNTYEEDFALTFNLSTEPLYDIGTHEALIGVSLAGQISGSQSPIGTTDVHVYSGSQVRTVQTDDDGWYLAEGLPPGEALAWASPSNHATTYSPDDDRPVEFVEVPSEGLIYDQLDIDAPLSHSIHVVLEDATTEMPINGASVMLYNDTKTVGKGRPVDENGLADFTQLHPGDYSIQYYAENDGFSNGTLLDDQGQDVMITVADGGDTPVQTISLLPTASLIGTILDDQGAPVYGADILATQGDFTRRATSNIDGEYTLYGLDTGSWSILVQYAPYCPDDIQYVTFYYPNTPDPEGYSLTTVVDSTPISLDWVLPQDWDRDEMSDQWEERNNLDTDRDDSLEDPDEDGISNLQEYRWGTNPNESDTIKPNCGCKNAQALFLPIIFLPFLGIRRR